MAQDKPNARLVRFRLEAAKHVPVLIEGDRRSIKYRDALKWWNDCNCVETPAEAEAA